MVLEPAKDRDCLLAHINDMISMHNNLCKFTDQKLDSFKIALLERIVDNQNKLIACGE